MIDSMLIKNNFVSVSGPTNGPISIGVIGTIISNLAYYGYTLSADALSALRETDDAYIHQWWKIVDNVLSELTGDNKDISSSIVYKNFPREVLSMSEEAYFINRILIYLGIPSDILSEEQAERKTLHDDIDLKVLHLSDDNTIAVILTDLLKQPSRWTQVQLETVITLSAYLSSTIGFSPNIASVPFKENMILFAKEAIRTGAVISINSPTDILRLAVGMSDGDVSLRTNSKFRNFSRQERRFFLSMLERSAKNLNDSVSSRKEVWKRFLRNLHPNDYRGQYPNVISIQDKLYHNNSIESFNSLIETNIKDRNAYAIELAIKRPGDFLRRLQKMLAVFGEKAAIAFCKDAIPNLSTIQLLKLKGYLFSVNERKYSIYPPKGNWSKLIIHPNALHVEQAYIDMILAAIVTEVASRINAKIPGGVTLDESAYLIKIKDNDSSLTDYGRGTKFKIPDNVNFIRTSSYWELEGGYAVWYDNAFNFYDESWKSKGTMAWNSPSKILNNGAVFSGDPLLSPESGGRSGQMIDIYLDNLARSGVRYAVWSILCYSRKKFSEADCVMANLQWGEDAEAGKLFEPSRCQLRFPLNSDNLTSYIAYIDIKERVVVYMDASLKSNVNSAIYNEKLLEEIMPAYTEYLDCIPSISDLFDHADEGDGALVTFSDKDYTLNGQKAYVFRPENKSNKYSPISISKLLD
jgi:hypothetical protein